MKLLVQSTGKFPSVKLNLFIKTSLKLVLWRAFFKIPEKNKEVKKNYGFWKINEFISNDAKDTLPDYLLGNYFPANLLITFWYYYRVK